MKEVNPEIIKHLRDQILLRQGLQKLPGSSTMDLGLSMMSQNFPNNTFPLGAVHEFICTSNEDKTTSTGFITGILAPLMKHGGSCLWITPSQQVFPSALKSFGIDPTRIIFINLNREKEQLWMIEEALKCDSLSAVVGDIRNLDFTTSRRLQLAVEQSKVTGFLIRQTKHFNTNACVSRWRITTAASVLPEGMPGVGFPRWQVELLKIRNGKPGSWILEWRNKKFREVINTPTVQLERQRMIG